MTKSTASTAAALQTIGISPEDAEKIATVNQAQVVTTSIREGHSYTIVPNEMVAAILSEISETTVAIRQASGKITRYTADMVDSIEKGFRIDTDGLGNEVKNIAELNTKREILISVMRLQANHRELVKLAITPVMAGSIQRQMGFITQTELDSYPSK